MSKIIFFFLVVFTFFISACQRPEDESPSKFQRQANIKKYTQRAKDINRLSQEREKDLPVEELILTDRLTKKEYDMDMSFLDTLIKRNRHSLEKKLQEVYRQKTTLQLTELMNQYVQQTQQMAQQSASVEELTSKMEEILSSQNKEINEWLEVQKKMGRVIPDQQLLEQSKDRLQNRAQEFIDKIALYYAQETAQQSKAVTQRAIEDYIYAMASVPTQTQLDEKIQQITQNAQQELLQIAQNSGDPLMATSEELITALRAEMITKHQKLEQYIEPMFGKEAVLESRDIFNKLLQQGGEILRENSRLSQKKRALAHLNEDYKTAMLNLQTKWNSSLEKK